MDGEIGRYANLDMRDHMALSGIGQASLPDVVAWDPDLLAQPGHAVLFQRGCPAGYFSQFVAPGTPGARPYPLSMVGGDPAKLSQTMWVRCRLVETTTPDSLMAESGISDAEAASVFTGAVADTIAQIPERVRTTVEAAAGLAQWGVVALIALVAVSVLRK